MRLYGLFFLGASLAGAAAPVVEKVEPPNWWVGHSINPVRLLIRGKDLKGARLESASAGLTYSRIKGNEAGTYVFADLTISASASTGPAKLVLRTAEGVADVPFEVSKPLSRTGRFQGFTPDDVIYLIMPDRFANGDPSNDDPAVSRGMFDRRKNRYYHGGDLRGVMEKLPYLKDLGVTAIWLNPIYDNVNHLNERETYDGRAITDYHGYGAVDFYGVEEHFGDLALFRQLCDEAHKQGIKIILDMVANHSGPYHPWVADSPTPTWYNGTAANHLANTWQTWTLMDPSSTKEMQKTTLEGWFVNILPDLNQNDPETARYIIQNTLWWAGVSGLDGIRQDTLPYVPRPFWKQWMAAIKREYPKMNVVGEMFDGDPALVSFFQGGRKQFDGVDSGVDTLFDFPLYYAVRHAFAEGKPIREIAQTLAHDRLYVNPNVLVTFLGLHDVQRFMNEKGADVRGLKLAFTLLLTVRGTPMIYYGDEIAMPGGNDPDNRRDFPGGWKEDPRNAFTPEGRTPEESSVYEHVRKLAALRKQTPALRRGVQTLLVADEQVLVYARKDGASVALVAINNGKDPASVDVPVDGTLANGVQLRDRLGDGSGKVEQQKLHLTIPARTGCVYLPE